jgi:O-acetyl-ADP-ribose deacetylase
MSAPDPSTELARRLVGRGVVSAVQADLTSLAVDAVVNAANARLAHGGGVAAALARKGGPAVQTESDAWVAQYGPVGPGEAVVTTAGALPAAHIIHVVGPVYRPGQDNAGLLAAAVTAALDAAEALRARSVALPAISAGIYGYPQAEATRVIVDAASRWLGAGERTVSEVLLVGYDQQAAGDFAAALA